MYYRYTWMQKFFAWAFTSAQHGDYTGVCIIAAVLAIVSFCVIKGALNNDWQH